MNKQKTTVTGSLKGRDCLQWTDWTSDEIADLIQWSWELKTRHQQNERWAPLSGKTLAMIFDKPSTRTRVSFEVAMAQLGGHALALNPQDLQLGRGESLPDTARVLSGYVDGILIRTHAHTTVKELAEYASVPVINGLTDLHHPCQALADLLTLKEMKGELAGLKLAYVGDGNNVLHSLMEAAVAVGIHLMAAFPEGYAPETDIVEKAQQVARSTSGSVTLTKDPREAVQEADAVYTDVWASMGQEEEKKQREVAFAGFQVNEALMALAKADALFLHCLPAYRGLEVSAAVMESRQSAVFQQAENRLHAQKALLTRLMG